MSHFKTVCAWVLAVLALTGCGIDRGGIDLPPDPAPVDPAPEVYAGVLRLADNQPGLFRIGEGVAATLIDPSQAAVIRINGVTVGVDDLQPGMYARAYSDGASDSAVDVDFNLAGGVPERNTQTQRPEIFGTDIFTSSPDLENAIDTLADSASPEVAVSGYITQSASVDASAVLTYPATSPALLTGFAQDVDAANFRFNLGGHTIDYSGASVIDTESGGVEEFARLRVTLLPPTNGSELQAQAITQVHSLGPERFLTTRVLLVNYVSAVIDANLFRVGDVIFLTNAQTEFQNFSSGDVSADALVAIEGVIDTDGQVLVSRIERLD